MTPTLSCLDAALSYARRSWFVIPLHTPLPDGRCDCRRPCTSIGKHPRTQHGLTDATTDEATIRRWWGMWPNANVGIVTGPSRLVVVDIDPRHGGSESLATLLERHGLSLTDTIQAGTGGGGYHLVYLAPGEARIANVASSEKFVGPLGPGIDVRAWGGYIVAAPSLHASGALYEWIDGFGPDDREPARLPLYLFELLTPSADGNRDDHEPLNVEDILAGVPEGQRDWKLFQLASKLRYADIPLAIAYAIVEQAAANCTPPFPRAEARAKVDSAYRRFDPGGAAHVGPPPSEPGLYEEVNWAEFWATDQKTAEWLVEPLLPLGRQTALYSPAKVGKSLLTLDVVARLATGARVLDRMAGPPVSVVYLDMEMTAGDLRERLEDMGYGPDTDLSRLHYYLLPSLPPLDTPEGGQALLSIVREHDAALVVIDTTSRVISGAENDADTLRAFYRHTGLGLKSDGRTVWRLDHAGKDMAKGQRGTSAKADDVDLVWELTAYANNTVKLRATHRRQSWVPEEVMLLRNTDPVLVHARAATVWPGDTDAVAKELDRRGAPLDVTNVAARAILRDPARPFTASNDSIAHAIRYRKERAERAEQTLHAAERPRNEQTFENGTPAERPGTEPAERSRNARNADGGNAERPAHLEGVQGYASHPGTGDPPPTGGDSWQPDGPTP